MNDLQLWGLRLKSNKGMIFEINEHVVLAFRKAGRLMSWPQYVFVTVQGTNLILPCMTVLPPRMVIVCVLTLESLEQYQVTLCIELSL